MRFRGERDAIRGGCSNWASVGGRQSNDSRWSQRCGWRDTYRLRVEVGRCVLCKERQVSVGVLNKRVLPLAGGGKSDEVGEEGGTATASRIHRVQPRIFVFRMALALDFGAQRAATYTRG